MCISFEQQAADDTSTRWPRVFDSRTCNKCGGPKVWRLVSPLNDTTRYHASHMCKLYYANNELQR